MPTTDVVVIGAGHQGLVAAITLADAGLKVVVVEAADEIGGAVRSSELVRPGLVHDRYAMNMNLFLGSPFYATYGDELSSAGLEFSHCRHAYASAFPNAPSIRISDDADENQRMWEEHDPGDAKGWRRLSEVFADVASSYGPLSSNVFPSRSTASVIRSVLFKRQHTSVSELLQVMTSTTRSLGERYFASPEARSMAAAWGMHVDFAPDVAAGAIFPLLEMYADAEHGMNVVKGGASNLPRALAAMLSTRGVPIHTGKAVESIQVASGRVQGVRLADGEHITARHGILSTATLPAVVHRLLRNQPVPSSMALAADNFRFGPGTFMLHLALSGPIPWQDSSLADSAYVHLGPYVDDMARTYQQALAGVLPDEPLLVVGQTSTVDPSRNTSEDDRLHAVWIQVRMVPAEITGDANPHGAGGDLTGRSWDEATEPFVQRILEKLERYAPGVTESVIGHAAESPSDLQSGNANLHGGDSVSGSHHLDQFIGMRPSMSLSRYRTPIDGLYLAGASTWPGAGVNAVSGQRSAEQLVRGTTLPRRKRLPR
jgi:phytoene dehydrogenase-like protein